MMERTRAVLAPFQTRFGRGLPARTLRHGALRKREHTDDRRHSSQERPHTLGCVVAVSLSNGCSAVFVPADFESPIFCFVEERQQHLPSNALVCKAHHGVMRECIGLLYRQGL